MGTLIVVRFKLQRWDFYNFILSDDIFFTIFCLLAVAKNFGIQKWKRGGKRSWKATNKSRNKPSNEWKFLKWFSNFIERLFQLQLQLNNCMSQCKVEKNQCSQQINEVQYEHNITQFAINGELLNSMFRICSFIVEIWSAELFLRSLGVKTVSWQIDKWGTNYVSYKSNFFRLFIAFGCCWRNFISYFLIFFVVSNFIQTKLA